MLIDQHDSYSSRYLNQDDLYNTVLDRSQTHTRSLPIWPDHYPIVHDHYSSILDRYSSVPDRHPTFHKRTDLENVPLKKARR